MLTSSDFLLLQKEKLMPRESYSLDSYFEKSSASSHVTHLHSHYTNRRTQVWVEIMCFMGNKNIQQQQKPFKSCQLLNQWYWGSFNDCIWLGTFLKGQGSWKTLAQKRSYREGWYFKWEHIRPPFQALTLSPFQVTVSSQFTKVLPELCSNVIFSRKLSLSSAPTA